MLQLCTAVVLSAVTGCYADEGVADVAAAEGPSQGAWNQQRLTSHLAPPAITRTSSAGNAAVREHKRLVHVMLRTPAQKAQIKR